MADRKKTINGMECCLDLHTAGPGHAQGCALCPYHETPSDGANGLACFRAMVKDALELLKAQEPKDALAVNYEDSIILFSCRVCETQLTFGQRYCHMCGQAVKWDD